MPPAPGKRSSRRLYQLVALALTVALCVAVLVAVLGAGSTSQLAPGKRVPGAAGTLALLAGIPQRGVALGDAHAPLRVVEFGDLQCPACAQFATETLPGVIGRFVRSGRVLLEFRALDFIGPDSRRAGAMADALAQQNRLWQFVELAYRNQGLENSGYVTGTYLRALAAAIPGADVQGALLASGSAAVAQALAQASALARAAGVRATPSFTASLRERPPQRFSPPLDASGFDAALAKQLSGPAARS